MNFFIVLKDILLTSREDFENHKQHWEMRCQQYVHTNVIQVHGNLEKLLFENLIIHLFILYYTKYNEL